MWLHKGRRESEQQQGKRGKGLNLSAGKVYRNWFETVYMYKKAPGMDPKGKKALKCTNRKQSPRCGNWGGEIERECVI